MTDQNNQSNGNGAASTQLAPASSTQLAPQPQAHGLISPFASNNNFESAWRMAKALAGSTMVPKQYQGLGTKDAPGVGVYNSMIAIELASRIGVSVLAVMQSLDIIQGKPSFSAKFLIATVNASGRFTPIRFEWAGKAGTKDWACRARATDKESREVCEGPWVTWQMAEKEGWTKKAGSKWQTMPELMFTYRAAAFWARIFCPEISIGFQTTEEAQDIAPAGQGTITATVLPDGLTPGGAQTLEAILGLQSAAPDHKPETEALPVSAESTQPPLNAALGLNFDKETGEVKP